MSENLVYECDLFTLTVDEGKLKCEFNTNATTNTFMQTELFSKLLSSFSTDASGVWRLAERTDFEIVGWPKHLNWIRTGNKTTIASTAETEALDVYQYGEVLEKSLLGMMTRTEESDGGSYYHFSIANQDEVFEYSFNDRARVVGALCVLFDLKAHSRNHLEINIPAKHLSGLKWPLVGVGDEEVVRYYGDPSKTADVLRNEGWTREGDDAHMFVYRERINGQQQQMYKISTREQSRTQQVKRTAIKPIWRTKLFEMQEYTCRICLNDYSDDPVQLSPDHRVPVIFQADNLDDDNFAEKLMTLCRFCNQQKREFTKRIGVDYDWDSSPWAYPEKYRLVSAEKNLREYAKFSGITASQAVAMLAENL